MRPRRTILERLERLGIEADRDELLTPATLAASRCAEAGYESVSLVVLDELREDLEGLEERGDSVDAVIVGDLDEVGLRRSQPRLPAADGWRGPDRAAEEPLLGDRRGSVARRGALCGRPGVRNRIGGRGGREAVARLLRAGSRRAGGAGGARCDGGATTSRPTSEERWTRAWLVSWCGPGKYREDLVEKSRIDPTATVDSIAETVRKKLLEVGL